MDPINREDFSTWLKQASGPCVSIFMPVHPGSDQSQQDPIRLKNLLQAAQERLVARGLRLPDAEIFLEPAQPLFQSGEFWQDPGDGLALFITPEEMHTYRLPVPVEEQVSVGDRFYIKPLLPIFQNDRHFYLLTLSQGQVRFYHCTRYGIEEREVVNTPTNLDEFLESVAGPEPFSHPEGDARAARLSDGFDLKKKNDIFRFFNAYDKSLLQQHLAREQAPLVLAGVEYLFPIYHQASEYRYILEDAIPGNPEGLKDKELHERALQIVQPVFDQELEQAAGLYEQLCGQDMGRASSDIHEIIPAAHSGRVGQVFIAENEALWGRYDLPNNRVVLSEDTTAENEDLLNFVATQTLLNGGQVYTVAADQVPAAAPIAAIFRY